jgi:PleD family two-component response regulator
MRALKSMLERAGYEATPATTGKQALRLLITLQVDGLLLEYDRPDATVNAVRAEMKLIKPDVSVLLFAGVGGKRRSCFVFLMLVSERGGQSWRSRDFCLRLVHPNPHRIK